MKLAIIMTFAYLMALPSRRFSHIVTRHASRHHWEWCRIWPLRRRRIRRPSPVSRSRRTECCEKETLEHFTSFKTISDRLIGRKGTVIFWGGDGVSKVKTAAVHERPFNNAAETWVHRSVRRRTQVQWLNEAIGSHGFRSHRRGTDRVAHRRFDSRVFPVQVSPGRDRWSGG